MKQRIGKLEIFLGVIATFLSLPGQVASEAERSPQDAHLYGAANIIMKAAVKLPHHIIPIVKEMSLYSKVKGINIRTHSNRRSFRLFPKFRNPFRNSVLYKKKRGKKKFIHPFRTIIRSPVTPYPYVRPAPLAAFKNKDSITSIDTYGAPIAPILNKNTLPVLTPDLVQQQETILEQSFSNQGLDLLSTPEEERTACICCPSDEIIIPSSGRRDSKAQISIGAEDCSNVSPIEIKYQIQELRDQVVKRNVREIIPSSESDYYTLNDVMPTTRRIPFLNNFRNSLYLPRASMPKVYQDLGSVRVPSWLYQETEEKPFVPSAAIFNSQRESQIRKAQKLAGSLLRSAIKEQKKERPFDYIY